MKLLGLNFKEIHAVRGETGKLKRINNNLVVKNMELIDLPVSESGKALTLTFQYTADYEADPKGSVGNITLLGEAIVDDSKKTLTSVKKKWDKEKVLSDEFKPILQNLSNASLIEAVSLSKKVLLITPIPLPRIA